MSVSERKFIFRDSTNNDSLTVIIPEMADPNYGMYTWPCAPVLAQYLWHNRKLLPGKTVLELGSGTALPGVVSALCGAKVLLSDGSHLPECRENSVKSCKANGLNDVRVCGITWGRFDADLMQLPELDLLLASDCFYDTKDFENIIVTVTFLLQRNEHCEFWCTYQERSATRSIEHLLDKWDLTAERIPLATFDADKTYIAESDLPGDHTIHMYRLCIRHAAADRDIIASSLCD